MTIFRFLRRRPIWLASIVLAGATASFALWDPLAAYERAHVSRTTHQSMESLRADLMDDMQSRLFAQIRVAELWGDGVAFSERERELSCRLFLDHHAGYLLLEWLDPTYRVLYAIRRDTGDTANATDLSTASMLKAARPSLSSENAGVPIVTPRFHLTDGRSALGVIVPVVRHYEVAGFLVAIVDVRAAFDAMVDDHKDLGYSVSVSDASAEIYRMPGSRSDNEETLAHQGSLVLPGATWTVRVWPNREILSDLQSPLPKVAMVLGGLLGSVLMLAIHFGLATSRASREIQRAHDQLEERVKERTLELEHVNKALYSEVGDRKRAEDSYRGLSGRLMRLQDEERRRIARELHDSTAQMLGALAINVDRARAAVDTKDLRRLEQLLTESGEFVEEVTQEIRTVSYLLHPPMLDDLGLEYVLPWYAAGFGQRSGIETTLDIQPDLGRLPCEIELTLFRTVQEALANVHRHSGSPSVALALFRSAHYVTLEICDKGKGLPQVVLDAVMGANQPSAPIGVGIAGMRERVHQLKGQMEISSSKGGTTIRTVLPVTERAPADRRQAAPPSVDACALAAQ